MQSPQFNDLESETAYVSRRAFTVHRGQRGLPEPPPPPTDSSPLHSIRTLAGAAFVASAAAGWIAVAVTVTAPLVVAGELLSRAGKTIERRA